MDRKNRTYTLLEDSESDGEAVKENEKGKKKSKDKGSKRKHIRQKQKSESSSEDEPTKRYAQCLYLLCSCIPLEVETHYFVFKDDVGT